MATTPSIHFWFALALLLMLSLSGAVPSVGAESPSPDDPVYTLRAYLRATYARDYVEAYRFISSADRKVRDLNRYVRQRGAFNGFALEAAKKLSELVIIKLTGRDDGPNRTVTVVKYQVPDPHKLSSLLRGWDAYRLNSLAVAERKRILDTIDKKKRDGSLDLSEGEATFGLVKENGGWRIFLNWAAGVKVPFRLNLSNAAQLDVSLSKNEIAVQPGDLFDIVLKVKNRSDQPIVVRIGHLVAPTALADYLEFVQCGFLLPISLGPSKAEEFSGTYLLKGSFPEGVSQLSLTYDFRLLE